jgi:hypothetical protein
MWQKVELTADESTEIINGGIDSGEAGKRLAELGGILAQVNEMPDPPKKERKRKDTIISSDPINHPSHYKIGGIETIDFIEAKNLNYNLGNVIKYVSRAHHKNALVQDLKKAQFYLAREISNLEKL